MSIEAGGTFAIGGDMPVHRMGFGAMRLVGPHVWGMPADPDQAPGVLRRARALGVDFIDTAEAYGPEINERQIREALAPYPPDLVIATKCGITRYWPAGSSHPLLSFKGDPAAIRASTERSLVRLGVERIDLQQLHRPDPAIPIEETIGALAKLRGEGKIRHIGLSEVSVDQIEQARAVAPIATVQNQYNIADRRHEEVLAYCEAHRIGFIPWFPIGGNGAGTAPAAVARIARHRGATSVQVALAWLLARSSAILLIPGTSSIAHLQENIAACDLRLGEAEMAELTG